MATVDTHIGALPAAPQLLPEALLVLEQQGEAYRFSGAQLQELAREGVEVYVESARQSAEDAAAAVEGIKNDADRAEQSAASAALSAQNAAASASNAADSATAAEEARDTIVDLTVEAVTLPPGSEATVDKTVEDGAAKFTFGIPQGLTGNVMYATFSIDPDTGLLTMQTPDGYAGPAFLLNNGHLEVKIA